MRERDRDRQRGRERKKRDRERDREKERRFLSNSIQTTNELLSIILISQGSRELALININVINAANMAFYYAVFNGLPSS